MGTAAPRASTVGTASVDRERIDEVWARLAHVTDPELDEPMTELGFVEGVEVDAGGGVDVTFRLPTYWCSPNFAYLMADDIGRAVRALPWVVDVRPQLQDHMSAEEVNEGVRLGLPFAEAFKAFEVKGTLDELRENFRRKAFQRRQEAVLIALRAVGFDPATIVAMDLAGFDRTVILDDDGARQKPRYREILLERGLAAGPRDLAFVTLEGRPIDADALAAHVRGLRSVRINMEANGAICRGLLQARYREFDPATDEPTLADFMLDRVPPLRPVA